MSDYPALMHTALDATDVRALAEFYREFLGLRYRPGDEPPAEETGDDEDWLVLVDGEGNRQLAFQQVPTLARPSWPSHDVPKQMHLDFRVPTIADLERHRRRAEHLGASLLYDRTADLEEPLYVLADPAGHPFFISTTWPQSLTDDRAGIGLGLEFELNVVETVSTAALTRCWPSGMWLRCCRMASSCPVIDDFAKGHLHAQLRRIRQALVWKLDGLSEYDIRRPLTVTGTNLLGLVKHMATVEAWYFGEVFARPSPVPLGRWQDADGSDLWVTPDETREQIVDFYQRAWEHADATINELPLDAPGHVPWWSRPEVKLFNVMVHVLQETARHAGQADILREQIDGRTGVAAEYEEQIDTAAREAYRANVEWAAHEAAGGSDHANLSKAHGGVGTAL